MQLSARKTGLRALLAAIAIAVSGCAPTHPAVSISGYSEVPVDFTHRWNKQAHPFTGAAAIDIDGDNRSEVFVGGGRGQDDSLLAFRDGKLVNVIANTGLSSKAATRGATSLDMDGDGDVDLLVARDDGIYLYSNDQQRFSVQKIPVDLPENSVPFDIAVSDIDRDGDGDLYVSVFVDSPSFRSAVYNDPTHAKSNRLLLNNGDQTFTDITETSGTAAKQNTFVSAFVDLNGDGWQDLVVSQNTGEIEIFRNQGDLTFDYVRVDEGYGFWMGIAVGDIDRDGDQDLFFSNIGGSIPGFLTSGDLRDDQTASSEWLLLRNDGDFKFTNVTKSLGLTGQGFAWGAVFEDLNFDGELDLLVAQNYIKWPIHKLFKLGGKSFLRLAASDSESKSRFYQVDRLGLSNSYYGQSPLRVDINADGRPDTVWINMSGPARAFLNKEKGNFLTVRLPDSVATLGTKVRIRTANGPSYSRHVLNSIGLMTDQGHELTFGLGSLTSVIEMVIAFPDGTIQRIENPPINQVVEIRPSQGAD